MATIYKERSGYALQIGAGKNRRTKRLGKLSKSGAADVKHYANQLETARRSATIPPKAAIEWLDTITDDLHAVLADVGLCEPRRAVKNFGLSITMGKLLQDHLDRRPDLRPFTRSNYEQARKRCVEFFGAKAVKDITAAEAKDFKRWLSGEGYAPATVAGFVNKTRHILNDAVDRGVILANPFRKVPGGSQENEERLTFVSRETMAKVVAATADPEWKLLFTFARYAGVRVPSEVAGLSIDDVDFSAKRIVIHSPKTRKHGKPKRTIPLFPELRSMLAKAVADAKAAGRTKLLPSIRADYNPHTQAVRLIKAAGVPVWGKVFQNLRSTRETELLANHDLHVVCAWIGNSPAVARRHYLQIRGEDWDRATSAAECAALGSDTLRQLRQDQTENAVFDGSNAGTATIVCPDQGHNNSLKRTGKPRKSLRSAAKGAAHSPSDRLSRLLDIDNRLSRRSILAASRPAARRKAGVR